MGKRNWHLYTLHTESPSFRFSNWIRLVSFSLFFLVDLRVLPFAGRAEYEIHLRRKEKGGKKKVGVEGFIKATRELIQLCVYRKGIKRKQKATVAIGPNWYGRY